MSPSALPHTDHSLPRPGVETVVESAEVPDKGTCFILRASTGCTCSSCREDYFIEGPWRTEEGVKKRVAELTRQKRLRSQYSDTGVYTYKEVEYERAGRFLILQGKYAVDHGFVEDEDEFGDYEIDAYRKDSYL